MLSILIPVYNFHVSELVTELHFQARDLSIEFEIICLNDKSESKKPSLELEHFFWHSNEFNLGRAGTRNKLAGLAKHNKLLFLDADMIIDKPSFIKEYLSAAEESNVVCGGIHYSKSAPEAEKLLRWNYGRKKETSPAHKRALSEYLSFMTGNFLCTKEVIEKCPFDDSISMYGHEDTLFGKELLENGIGIKHIENSALHLGLETNKAFLVKSKTAIESLNQLYKHKKITRHYSGIIKLYENLKMLGLLRFVVSYSRKSQVKSERILENKGAPLWRLQLLKFFWFATLQEN